MFGFGKNKKSENITVAEMPSLLPENIKGTGGFDVEDAVAPAALLIESNYVKLGEKVARTLFVFTYPRFLAINWFAPVINLDKVFDISIFIHPQDTNTVLRQLEKKVAEVQSQIHDREKKGLVRDPMLDTAHHDLEELRDNLQQAQERLFSFGLYITIYAENLAELNKNESEIRSILESKLVYAKPALFQQGEGLQTTFPLATDQLEINTKLNSSPISSLFPFTSFDLTSNKGILYGINRHNSSLVLFDRFSLENYNSVVFAKSGSGKSYATKLEILRSMMLGTEVIVIDPEREYEYLAETVDGRYFNISLSSHHHINPFDLPPPREDESPADLLRSNIINLIGLFRIMFGGLTPEEDSILDRAITETYASRDITPDADFSKATMPILSDLELVLANMEGGESLAQKLRKYTQGTWAGFINQPSNVDINKKLVVFSVRDMEDELRPIAIYLIVHHVWNAVRTEIKKRLLIVDEAWWIMKTEDGASFLFGIAKRARKYYLGISTITQDVGDFLNSEYGKAIITNSSIQLLLKQAPAAIDILKQTFNLTEEEKFLLLESDVGEGIFFAGMKHVAIKILASYTEDQIITSDPSQLLAIKKAKEDYKESNLK
ncbi:conjugal transfer protein TraC [Candidatus Giovannonibacteria bacterium RIFCSPLOWO2_02_FULL_43_11b]|uniref:Conjugal transfer protein TraC n=1 Tax=Candidatus Giovannonibacteria bacterium RIFCSPHIGHO2_12_FULL_43_15 TaxID=1798341 RepID=A0A1F5WPE0_9BACT|nr:MAG: conjugal transfer protein TraC [Candidatus Giovannonibacteria bacterium RIFCSPHIGHO2_02_FULL_43_32]OGF77518.1 MAG: conjugal transfer protein TraC [Candidatus Giovannonibacteria bacterium RIFCSPHIGHO2_12_FULL_43_15]OGF89962.1 MAG: conjugal transfer protein TraC [Candidatus Giovannonibacteria bacterium RIFCSPLOWO2_02_FULL_43_11b]OGF92598.1 MAG: conjugal transfer protein TraC [Candidatus Giovannonibacteria bacterium RIFCSPLOWO2_12_FULL_43_11c]